MHLNVQLEKSLTDCLLVGVYAKQLLMNEKLNLTSSEFVIHFRNDVTLDSWYWRLEWAERTNGQDMLIIHEQQTPAPLQYTTEPIISDDYFILNSRFSFDDNVIRKVIGYGESVGNEAILTTLVFEFEYSYLVVNTGPIIEMRYVQVKPIIEKAVVQVFV